MMTSKRSNHYTSSIARAKGFRSGLEETIEGMLAKTGIPFQYEGIKLEYEEPATVHKYTPDFTFKGSNIIIETKGRFVVADRKKHLLLKNQYPNLDFRFVFSNSKNKISKGSKTTYAMWCEKNGFLYADKTIPQAWLNQIKKGE